MKEGSRLLLIEDDEVAASSLRQVLCEEGYAVTVAERGDVGLEAVAEGNYDVVHRPAPARNKRPRSRCPVAALIHGCLSS